MRNPNVCRLLAGFALALLLGAATAQSAEDGRMQVFVQAGDDSADLNKLHTNIQYAAQLALPRLWDRLVTQQGRETVAGDINPVRFLQRATPTETGVIVTFSKKRVVAYLKERELPVIEEEPSLNLEVQLYSPAGQPMGQSASMLQAYAAGAASDWGVSLGGYGPSLVLQWNWLDQQQVNLTVRGTTLLGEYSESRWLGAGDPVPQLGAWLVEVLLRARDATAAPPVEPVTVVPDDLGAPTTPGQPVVGTMQEKKLLLTIERRASLAEQVLFEDELRREQRVVGLLLHRVNRQVQQYRLHLSDADDAWLVEWFRLRGMELTPVVEGWVAR